MCGVYLNWQTAFEWFGRFDVTLGIFGQVRKNDPANVEKTPQLRIPGPPAPALPDDCDLAE
jgi:hypothetical protein